VAVPVHTPVAGFSRMALPALNAPSALTTFSLSTRALVQGPWCLFRLQHPASGRNRCPSGRPRFFATAGSPRVLSVPKQLRDHRQHEPTIETLALRIFLSMPIESDQKPFNDEKT
jgi:hypothetical protein